MTNSINDLLFNKAKQVITAEKRYKHYIRRSHFVVAIGVTKKGNIIACNASKPAQAPKKLKQHAEGAIMLRFRNKVDTIYIARFNRKMEPVSIKPCAVCAALARRLNIKIKSLEVNMTQRKKKKVLIICGGGVFGCIPAYFLGSLPKEYQDLTRVDLISGCSIGGILAAVYAAGNDFSYVAERFPAMADECFERRFVARINPLACPTYTNNGLEQAIKKLIPDSKKLGDIRASYPNLDIVIPTLNLTDNKYKVYDNIVMDEDLDKRLNLIALETAAAPSYFYGVKDEGKCIIDGGLIEVAPLLTATTALKSKRGIPFKDMDVLMIGVGTEVDRAKLSCDDYNDLTLLGLATKVIVPYVTEANELATVFWGSNLGFNSFQYFNPCKISGSLDDTSRITESMKEAGKYRQLFIETYKRWLEN